MSNKEETEWYKAAIQDQGRSVALLSSQVHKLKKDLEFCQRLLGQAMMQVAKHNGIYYFNSDFKPTDNEPMDDDE